MTMGKTGDAEKSQLACFLLAFDGVGHSAPHA